MMVRVENRKLFIGLLVGLVALAWLSLWLWGESPHGRFLDHHRLSEITNRMHPCWCSLWRAGR
jgi:hypothetical protein